jgi:hypothetical protein
MAAAEDYVIWFDAPGVGDGSLVGGKNALEEIGRVKLRSPSALAA